MSAPLYSFQSQDITDEVVMEAVFCPRFWLFRRILLIPVPGKGPLAEWKGEIPFLPSKLRSYAAMLMDHSMARYSPKSDWGEVPTNVFSCRMCCYYAKCSDPSDTIEEVSLPW